MDWPVLIIILIPVAVWVLATIFRGVEEAQEKNRQQQRPLGDGAQVKVPRRPAGELDRFLEEARRRREPSPPRRTVPQEEPALPERVPVERPAPRPSKREESRPRPKVEPRPAPEPSVVVLAVPVQQPEPAPVPVPVPPPPPPPAPPPAAAPPRRMAPLLTRLGGMLRDRESLALAFVLREVFDRPVSQRRYG